MQRAAPVIRAVKAYVSDTGRPPASLQAQVPRYLPRLPAPGDLAQGGWQFQVGRKPRAGGWALWVKVRGKWSPNPWSFGDVLAFHPSGSYDRSDYGGILERAGRWGYYHE